MKIIAAAIALAFAMPAAAQTAPAHDMGNMNHQQHGQPQGQAPADHSQHREHGSEGGCCADRDGDGRMDCCQHMAEAADHRGCCAEPAPTAGARPQAHPNH
jgi:hypothetical protein